MVVLVSNQSLPPLNPSSQRHNVVAVSFVKLAAGTPRFEQQLP